MLRSERWPKIGPDHDARETGAGSSNMFHHSSKVFMILSVKPLASQRNISEHDFSTDDIFRDASWIRALPHMPASGCHVRMFASTPMSAQCRRRPRSSS